MLCCKLKINALWFVDDIMVAVWQLLLQHCADRPLYDRLFADDPELDEPAACLRCDPN